MGFQFVLGATGTGKTEYVIQKMHRQKEAAIYIVPEQYTLQAQEDVIQHSEAKGILDIEVLSFNRLVYRYFDELGLADTAMINDTGKSMLIRKILESNNEELVWIKKHQKKQGYMDELNKLLKECHQYNVDIETLNEYIQKVAPGLLQDKLKDLKVLLNEFDALMHQGYLTSEHAGMKLIEQFPNIQSLRETTIYIDGFYGFTPLQYAFIEQFMAYCKDIVFIVTLPAGTHVADMKNEADIYYESKKMLSRIREIGDRIGIIEHDAIWKETIYRSSKKSLQHLIDYLYQYPVKPYQKSSNSIRLMEGATIEAEVEAAVCRIHQLITEQGVRYREIILLVSDLELYKTPVKTILENFEIPVFIDQKETISSHPLVQFILSAMLSIQYNFKYETVFYHLKSLYYKGSEEDIHKIENYVLAHGIKRKRQWENTWEEYDALKNELIGPFMDFANTFKSAKTVRERTEALYKYLKRMDIYVKNMDMMQYFQEHDQLQRADSYQRVYTLIVELLDEMVDLIGDEKVTIKDYSSLIETGLTQIKMGQTPPSVDQIIVGDLSRTRFREVDYVFVLGVNEGKVPLVRASNQLLTDYERSTLLELGLELAPNQEKSLFKEQMNIFMGLTRSRKLLHISYARVLEEKTERPATLIFLLRKMFPKMAVESAGEIIEGYNKPTPCYALFNRLVSLAGSRSFRDYEDEIQKLYIFFNKAYNSEGKMGVNPKQFIEGIDYQNKPVKLEPINQDSQSSVSQFETYAGCSYKHFLTYRLGVRERGEYVISMPDIGILFHRCLELYMKKCFMRRIDIHTITVALRNQLIEESIKEALDIDHMTIFTSSHRNRYLIVKLTRILKRAIWGIEEQLKRSKFKPKEAEYSFSGREFPVDNLTLKVSDQHKTYLTGVVDRVDEYETEDALHFSIVDYKSGSKDLDFNLVKEGIQLQLIIYMNVIEEIKAHKVQKKVIPCGMYYYRIQDPILNINDTDVSDIEDERLKSLKLRGLLLHDEQILRYFDETIDQSSLVVPASLNKNGSISKKSSTIEEVDLGILKNFVQKKAKEIATDIYDGQLRITPYRYKEETGCDYCQYKSICRFDPTNTTEDFHQIKPDSKENVFEEMKGDPDGRSHQKNHSD